VPRKITERMTLDDVETEILYTEAALRADPDAEDLLPLTDNWLDRLDQERQRSRDVRRAVATVDATRIVADGRLDQACTAFGDELYLETGKNRNSPRWKQFFNAPVSRFVRTALPRQVTRVRAWLQANDPVLERHRPEIEKWVARADDSLVKTRGLALTRGEAAIARTQFVEDLTHDRDGLSEALAARARERGLGRQWPDNFFRSSSRSSSMEAPEEVEGNAASE